ncbi:polyribonucleotide nucleotidyltransferase [bacterium]|nr:polyribonucleotide nucleotidyltransferase [bacterium]
MEHFKKDFTVGDITFRVETGLIAKQAGGAVMVYVDGLTLLCCSTATRDPREGIDFFPLMCEYEERFYAAGKFPGGFIKREGRPSENAVLTARKVDRTIRPMFPDDFHNEVQVIVTAMSQDNVVVPDVYAITGASTALALSNIPWDNPIAAVRVGYVNGEFIINPTFEQLEESQMDLLVSGTRNRVNMIEDESQEVPVEIVAEGIRRGHEAVIHLIDQIEDFAKGRGRAKMDYEPVVELDDALKAKVERLAQPRIEQILPADTKEDLFALLDNLKKTVAEELIAEDEELDAGVIKRYVGKLVKQHARKLTMQGTRVDGRGYHEIRPITGMVDLLPRVHGSAVFTRGQTQVVSCVTLGSGGDRQRIDTVNFDETKRYTHHYNFPPYSVGEVRFMRGASRREIGHGALAEKAVEPVLPTEEVFPYTIRVVSEVTESNASSSMASTCGSSMALMAAGVPITKPVGGISIGLVTDGDEYRLLMDLCGFEDFNGDMDFKVTGTRDGVTAIQLDVKIEGLTVAMVAETLKLAYEGYCTVIDQMSEIIAEPREEISPYAPMLEMLQIDVDQIGLVIGPSGKHIKKICADTGAEVDIDEDGRVFVSGTDHDGVMRALNIIRAMTTDIEPGGEFNGKVVRIMPFGAFIELVPGRDGFLHISNVAERRIDRVEDVLDMNDIIPVRVEDVDDQGKISLIRTDIDYGERPERRSNGGERRGGGGGRDRGRNDRGGRDRGPRNDRGGRDRGPRNDRGRSDRGDRGGRSERGGSGSRGDDRG